MMRDVAQKINAGLVLMPVADYISMDSADDGLYCTLLLAWVVYPQIELDLFDLLGVD